MSLRLDSPAQPRRSWSFSSQVRCLHGATNPLREWSARETPHLEVETSLREWSARETPHPEVETSLREWRARKTPYPEVETFVREWSSRETTHPEVLAPNLPTSG